MPISAPTIRKPLAPRQSNEDAAKVMENSIPILWPLLMILDMPRFWALSGSSVLSESDPEAAEFHKGPLSEALGALHGVL